MPIIKPFRGITYNPDKVNLTDVVAPPYDVISPEQQAELYHRSPHNVVRLILGREEDRYASGASYEQHLFPGRIVADQPLRRRRLSRHRDERGDVGSSPP